MVRKFSKKMLEQIKTKTANGKEPSTLKEAIDIAVIARRESRREGMRKDLAKEALEQSLASMDDVINWYLSRRLKEETNYTRYTIPAE